MFTRALDSVSIIQDSKKVELTLKSDIEDACYEENYNKFSQMIETPTMSG